MGLKRFGFYIVAFIASLTSCALLRSSGRDHDQTTRNETSDRCLQINRSYGVRQSLSCERKEVYDFLIAGQRWTFEKRDYQERLRIRLGHWLLKQGIPLEQINEGRLEIWIGTHVFAPDLPLMRVQVVTAGGNILIEMPFDPAAWNEPISTVFILGKGLYPDHSGIKGGKLLVELKAGVKAREFRGALQKVSGADLQEGSEESSLFYVSTPFLREAWTRTSLLSAASGDGVLKQVYFIPAGEVAGEFAKAFEFMLVPYKNI
jgi:hypothetical protein